MSCFKLKDNDIIYTCRVKNNFDYILMNIRMCLLQIDDDTPSSKNDIDIFIKFCNDLEKFAEANYQNYISISEIKHDFLTNYKSEGFEKIRNRIVKHRSQNFRFKIYSNGAKLTKQNIQGMRRQKKLIYIDYNNGGSTKK